MKDTGSQFHISRGSNELTREMTSMRCILNALCDTATTFKYIVPGPEAAQDWPGHPHDPTGPGGSVIFFLFNSSDPFP